MKKPVVLLILDGWGESEEKENNSIKLANTPNYDRFEATYPKTVINASGEYVGLPDGQMGNSEVGHLNIGSGRVVYQDLTKIDKAIREGTFFTNGVLVEGIKKAVAAGKKVHLCGLLSDGGVHSHISHIKALVKMCKDLGAGEVILHGLLDGRDVPPTSAGIYIEEMASYFKEEGIGRIGTIAGRYYTMDRDKRWDRVQLGYEAMCCGKGYSADTAEEGLKMAYDRGETDEFVKPTVIGEAAVVGDGDTFIFFNFRGDRAREISYAFADPDFDGFPVKKMAVDYICMTEYDETLKAPVAFPPDEIRNTLGAYLSEKGMTQARIAETEKYAHVTFFFNGGVEEPNAGEDRILVPSPKVATYDLKPEMSLYEVTDKVVEAVESGTYDVIIVNFANGDMVGHTGVLEASIKAVEAVDVSIGRVEEAVLKMDGVILLTADHGNSEKMTDGEGKPFTAHTTNLVPFFVISRKGKDVVLRDEEGLALQDISPTILDLLDLPVPSEMTGKSLIK